MSNPPNLLYRSPNGDTWWLLQNPISGRLLVRHEANLSSGGRITELAVEAFLAQDGAGPEYAAARRLMPSRAESIEPRQ